jgi:Glycosyl hydrolase family 1
VNLNQYQSSDWGDDVGSAWERERRHTLFFRVAIHAVYMCVYGGCHHARAMSSTYPNPEPHAVCRGYLDNMCQAIAKGVRVTTYFAWSFLDNFEVCVCVTTCVIYVTLIECTLDRRLHQHCAPLAEFDPIPPTILCPQHATRTHARVCVLPQWREGYSERFGINRVDFSSPQRTRTTKDSGFYLSKHFFSVSRPGMSPEAAAAAQRKKPAAMAAN